MSVWVESVSTNQFKVCLQESRTFDGAHNNIAVVRYPRTVRYYTFLDSKDVVPCISDILLNCLKINIITKTHVKVFAFFSLELDGIRALFIVVES